MAYEETGRLLGEYLLDNSLDIELNNYAEHVVGMHFDAETSFSMLFV